ncbi:MAG: polysaccharide deacetylase [Dehalococcoidia bacterium]|nr:polysaccharide deacetylase [Dehalococcoidia bacterium]MDW8119033.1 polysaccharide deacetylase [Chloroflexota bacterium]
MAGIWPEDIRCVVMLTFDVDGKALWIRRNPAFARYPSLMSMGEYGPRVATPRILDVLDTFGIKATFFIPGFVAETHADLVRDIVRRGHEVGHHGYMHEAPATCTPEEEVAVLDKGITILESLTGQKPLGYRSPSWELSERSLPLLASRGFLYDSSLMGDDAPYWVSAGEGRRLIEIPVHWEWDDFPYFAYAPSANIRGPMHSPDAVFAAWAAGFEGVYRWGRAFCLTMHPQVIGRPGRLLLLERLIRHMRSFPGVAFLRCRDVAEMWAAQHAPDPVVEP